MPHHRNLTEGLRSFFEQFQTLSAVADIDGLAAMHAPQIMFAGPNGPMIVTSADLLRAIPRRKQLLDLAGHRDTTLIECEETPLTPRYSLVRTQWRWRFAPIGGEPAMLTLPSTYIVDLAGDQPHIVLYMNEQDITGLLRERGMLPT